jgi:phosphodiesterase/alkaline phosphatase D-like protein
MIKPLLKLAVTATIVSLLSSNPTAAQTLPPAKKAARVIITKGPVLELATDDLAFVRWITTNPGGSDVHFGVVSYGTNPKELSETAKSEIRVNRAHPETMFRVRVVGLKPRTTYYYRVTSIESNGNSDGVESPVRQFTTPGPGERIAASTPLPWPSSSPQLAGMPE